MRTNKFTTIYNILLLTTLCCILTISCFQKDKENSAKTDVVERIDDTDAAPVDTTCCLNYSAEVEDPEESSDKSRTVDTLELQLKKYIAKQLPKYSYAKHFIGDIDDDGDNDVVLIIERPCDSILIDLGNVSSFDWYMEGERCRKTLLLEQKANNKFKVVTQNDDLVGCSQCGGAGVGDAMGSYNITKGIITYTYLMGACDKTEVTHTYKYDKSLKKWFLKSVESFTYTCRFEGSEVPIIDKTIETDKDFGLVEF